MENQSLNKKFYSNTNWESSLRRYAGRINAEFHRRNKHDPLDLTIMDITRNQEKLRSELIALVRTYKYNLEPGKQVMLQADKQRISYNFTWLDSFLLFYLAETMFESVKNRFPPCLYSFIPGKSNIQAIKKAAAFVEERKPPLFIIKYDVEDFGASMDHEILIRLFKEYFSPSEELITLFQKICTFSYFDKDGILKRNIKGLPTGHYIQLIFENLYLLSLDEYMSGIKNTVYSRYGDDLLFITPDIDKFNAAKNKFQNAFTELNLKINQKKSKDLLLEKPHRFKYAELSLNLGICAQFEYLGAQIDFKGQIQLPQRKSKLVRQQIKGRLGKLNKCIPSDCSTEGRIKILIAAARQYLRKAAYIPDNLMAHYMPLIRTKEQQKEFDNWLLSLILNLSLKKGWKKGNFRRYPVKQLREWGLPTLQHQKNIREL